MKQTIASAPRPLGWLIHVIGWGLVFAFPLFFMNRQGNHSFSWIEYLHHLTMPLSFFIVFYLNYFILIPHYLFRERKNTYLWLNAIIILAVVIGAHCREILDLPPLFEIPKKPLHRPPIGLFLISNTLMLVLTAGLSAAIRLSARWTEIESARREAERQKTEAELKNLKNQLNPHFLLNTLNNIYALIAFNSDKAQEAVQELSKLLRYVLYDNQQTFVPLYKEAEFIRNYIELMRIRQAAHVKVETDLSVRPDSQTLIAPLIFISLIENAFKHGISPTQSSFIRLSLCEEDGEVICSIVNSYYPKTSEDKSGSGIGQEQVSKRLELLYPGRYEWKRGMSEDKQTYSSILTIRV